MDSERLRIQGTRELKATLDTPERGDTGDTDAVVVACAPHPQMGGDRRDGRLRAVGEALCERGVACLRVDYGPYDEGRAERRDIREALSWARERSNRTGLFGYSFGAGVPADHFFVGQQDRVARQVADFLAGTLGSGTGR